MFMTMMMKKLMKMMMMMMMMMSGKVWVCAHEFVSAFWLASGHVKHCTLCNPARVEPLGPGSYPARLEFQFLLSGSRTLSRQSSQNLPRKEFFNCEPRTLRTPEAM
eukprot:2515786-Amphidinium_carterae.1